MYSEEIVESKEVFCKFAAFINNNKQWHGSFDHILELHK